MHVQFFVSNRASTLQIILFDFSKKKYYSIEPKEGLLLEHHVKPVGRMPHNCNIDAVVGRRLLVESALHGHDRRARRVPVD